MTELRQEIIELAMVIEIAHNKIKELKLPRRSFKEHQRTWEIGGDYKKRAKDETKRSFTELRKLEILLRERDERLEQESKLPAAHNRIWPRKTNRAKEPGPLENTTIPERGGAEL